MQKYHHQRSLSRKSCSPDNAACEGFFGQIKNECFYGRSFRGYTINEFRKYLDGYIRWYNESRIKMSRGNRSPVEYRLVCGYADA
ncbi:MAG: IS3 family transposase [Oxalobacter sp.]